jgi:triphosphoribosyl-dephospho-CoA synthase
MAETSLPTLTIGQCATLACLLEATAPKVGNVHRGSDFDDLTFHDFAISAVLIGPAMESASVVGVGRAVLEAIRVTRQAVGTNTNLGMVLLVAPLAVVPVGQALTGESVGTVLEALTAEDCRFVYEAIRLAQPGGLGKAESMDVAEEAPASLLDAMRAAASRDLVARQYAEDFMLVLETIAPSLVAGRERNWSLTETIIHTHIALLAEHHDSLILRKCGEQVATQASAMAAQVLACGGPGDEDYYAALADFDFWLRADGNRRNPGTTADLIAAGLFVALREGELAPPWR